MLINQFLCKKEKTVTLSVKNKSAEKNVGKNYWSVKILVNCTKFSNFLLTKFT